MTRIPAELTAPAILTVDSLNMLSALTPASRDMASSRAGVLSGFNIIDSGARLKWQLSTFKIYPEMATLVWTDRLSHPPDIEWCVSSVQCAVLVAEPLDYVVCAGSCTPDTYSPHLPFRFGVVDLSSRRFWGFSHPEIPSGPSPQNFSRLISVTASYEDADAPHTIVLALGAQTRGAVGNALTCFATKADPASAMPLHWWPCVSGGPTLSSYSTVFATNSTVVVAGGFADSLGFSSKPTLAGALDTLSLNDVGNIWVGHVRMPNRTRFAHSPRAHRPP